MFYNQFIIYFQTTLISFCNKTCKKYKLYKVYINEERGLININVQRIGLGGGREDNGYLELHLRV